MGQITYTTNDTAGNLTFHGNYLYGSHLIVTNTGNSATTFNITYTDVQGEDSNSIDLVDGDLFN